MFRQLGAKTIIAVVLVVLGMQNAVAQDSYVPRFRWGLQFDSKFDNREFSSFDYASAVNSKTYFSARLAPVIGLGWGGSAGKDGSSGERHDLMVGGSFTLDMGSSPGNRPIELLLYYNYDAPDYSVYVGKFERRHLIGSYSRAIYSGSNAFYDNVIDGLALQYHPPHGKLELALDWDGMQSAEIRESFRVLSAGEYNPGKIRAIRWLAIGYSLDMYHLSSRSGRLDGVVEHILVNPWIGGAFERLAPWFERLTLQVGWMNSFDRDRKGAGRWLMPGGVTVDATIQKWKVGIRNRLYAGDKQMPLRETYGSRIYRGDPFYSVSGIYNYTQIYWHPQVARGVELQLELGIHTDGKKVGWQQVAWIGVSLDSSLFKRK